MSKNYSKKSRLKYVFLAVACTATFSFTGLVAACTPETTEEDEKKVSKEDTQLLKNGNFEFFDVPEKEEDGNAPVYLINSPNNWTHEGTSSYTMTGIIGTSKKAWELMSDISLADKLDTNNQLDSSAKDYKELYVDYNGMKSSDIPYKDTWAALNESSIEDWDSHFNITTENGKYYFDGQEVYLKTEGEGDDEVKTYYFDTEKTQPISKAVIDNPGTHYNVSSDNDGLYYTDENGDRVAVYEDENGDYYLEKSGEEYKQPISHVLMLHNYATTHNGINQDYSSISLDLPANTAAEVSLWVKTSNLRFNQGEDVRQDRGANITVTHTAGTTTLDDFAITCINTEKLISEGKYTDEYDGWIKYSVYINACDFASSTITLKLGLGESDYLTEGYAFFDDVTVTQYKDLDASACDKDAITATKASCLLESDKSEKIFKADSYIRNEGISGSEIKDNRSSNNFEYLIDLASENKYNPVNFNSNVSVGLTVDSDNYVSSFDRDSVNKFGISNLDVLGNAKLPEALKYLKGGNGLTTSDDIVAVLKAQETLFTSEQTKYYEKLNNALKGAVSLPKADNFTGDNNLLVMLSANGAGYTSSFELTADKEYEIVSFWVKTSDMDGNTAATVKITEVGNKDNTTNFTLDSTGISTDIDEDNEDIYDGWVQCFFFIHNDLDRDDANYTAPKYTVEFSFGNTTINGTAVTSYKPGWAALANFQTLEVNEDTFAYTGSGNYTASLTFSEDEEKKTNVFDDVYGSQSHEIKNNIVNPSTYTGVNGASSSVVNNGYVSIPYDDINSTGYENGVKIEQRYAGLINRDNVENYVAQDWYKTLITNYIGDAYSTSKALDNWNEVFGTKSVQPLIIVNKLRESYVLMKDATADSFKSYYIKNDDGSFEKVAEDAEFDENETYYNIKEVLNYGFIGSDKTISSSSYETISVKVKVSSGAIAYIYLVDTSAGKNVLGFNTPNYSFWYDADGNVLKGENAKDATLAEQRANILYTPRTDGLYENEKGELYANTWNYTKLYTDETIEYYDKDGNSVLFDNLVSGETYYDKDGNEVNHYLVTTSGVKVFEYTDGYHYIVEGKAQTEIVHPFETEYAKYTSFSEDYVVVLDGNDANIANKWITVNFFIHTGSESKSYRLELWSGERENAKTEGNNEGGSIIFDYSYTSVSDDTLKDEYENEIIKAYQTILSKHGLLSNIATSEENIDYYKNLVDGYIQDGSLDKDELSGYEILNNYTSRYFTYNLYDSASYQPFNSEVSGEDATGYDYNMSDYSEALAYLNVKDGDSYNIFADYSTVDQSISLNNPEDSDDDETEDSDTTNNTNVWLLASSILLVVALLFAMIAIFVKDALKKARHNQTYGKNTYNHNKTNRYIRKLGIHKEEFEEVDAPAEDNAETNEEQITETPENNVEEQNVSDAENSAEENSEDNGDSQY